MKKIYTILIVLTSWIIEFFALSKFFSCFLFQSNFYFTKDTLATALINATNADKGIPIPIVRVIHNKPLALSWGMLQSLLQYFDIRFLIVFVGLIGAIGVGFAVWYYVTRDRKNKFLPILFSSIIVLSLFEIYFMPQKYFSFAATILGLIFQVLSLYGIWQFVGQKNTKIRIAIIMLLWLTSLLFFFVFPTAYQNFCISK